MEPGPASFATTHWSVVTAASGPDPARSGEALNRLCSVYWYPLYAFVRRQGYAAADAEDLTQGFFAELLRRGSLAAVAPEKGRFRTFLLVALKRHVANERERARAGKRGGGAEHVTFDTSVAESRYLAEPSLPASAEAVFERRWALTLLGRAMERLKAEAAARGRSAEFESLKRFLTAEPPEGGFAQVGAGIGLSEGAARVAVHRLRHRFRDLFREEIAPTVARPEDVEDEIRHLLASLGD